MSEIHLKVNEVMIYALSNKINEELEFLKKEYGYDRFFCNLPKETQKHQDFIYALREKKEFLISQLSNIEE